MPTKTLTAVSSRSGSAQGVIINFEFSYRLNSRVAVPPRPAYKREGGSFNVRLILVGGNILGELAK